MKKLNDKITDKILFLVKKVGRFLTLPDFASSLEGEVVVDDLEAELSGAAVHLKMTHTI
jgi:hypothetical protein